MGVTYRHRKPCLSQRPVHRIRYWCFQASYRFCGRTERKHTLQGQWIKCANNQCNENHRTDSKTGTTRTPTTHAGTYPPWEHTPQLPQLASHQCQNEIHSHRPQQMLGVTRGSQTHPYQVHFTASEAVLTRQHVQMYVVGTSHRWYGTFKPARYGSQWCWRIVVRWRRHDNDAIGRPAIQHDAKYLLVL